jgi:hypothetical protein
VPLKPDRLGAHSSPRSHLLRDRSRAAFDWIRWRLDSDAVWIAALTVPIGVGWFYALRDVFFLQDDFINFQIARRHSFPSLRFLGIPDIGRFSPLHRLIHWIHWSLWPMSWPAAVAIDIVLLALAGIFFYRLLDASNGKHKFHLILLLLFLGSPLWAGPFRWWAAAMHVVPATTFGLMALDGFARYVRSEKHRFLVQTAVGFMLALSAYEKALFLIPYSALLQVLYLSRGNFRERLLGLRSAWPAHVCLWGISGIYLAIVLARYYHGHPQGDPASFLKAIWLGWFETLAPSFIGLGPSRPPSTESWGKLAAAVGTTAFVARSLWRGIGTWRAWLLFGFGFAAAMIFVVIYRMEEVGLELAREPRYVFEGSWLFLFSAGLAISADPRNPSRNGRPLLNAAFAFASLLGVLVFGAETGRAWVSQWEGRQTKDYFQRFESRYKELRTSEGFPALFDSDVPAYVLQPWCSPDTHLSNLLTLFHPELRFSSELGLGWAVDDRGEIRRASLEHISDLLPSGANAHFYARQGQLSAEGGYTCFARGSDGSVRAEVSFEHVPVGQYLRIEHANVSGWLKLLTRNGTEPWAVLTNNDDAEALARKKSIELWKLRRPPGNTVSIEVISAARVCLRIQLVELDFVR